MNGKNLIPAFLFIVMQGAFDNLAPKGSTTWSVIFFAAFYFTFGVQVLFLPKRKKLPYYIAASGFFTYGIIELFKLGMSYDDYMISISAYTASLLPALVLIAGLIYFIFKK